MSNEAENFFIRKYFIVLLVLIFVIKYVKRTSKQLRPNGKAEGMPSSRAAILFYLITVILLKYQLDNMTKGIIAIVCVAILGMKYAIKDHSILQIGVGAATGVAAGYLVLSL